MTGDRWNVHYTEDPSVAVVRGFDQHVVVRALGGGALEDDFARPVANLMAHVRLAEGGLGGRQFFRIRHYVIGATTHQATIDLIFDATLPRPKKAPTLPENICGYDMRYDVDILMQDVDSKLFSPNHKSFYARGAR